MIKLDIPTSRRELDEMIARDLNQSWYALKVLEHFERLAIIILLIGILFTNG